MAAISTTEQKGMQQIDLNNLNIPQLSTLKQQLDQDLNLFQESLASLKVAQSKFQNSGETVEKINPEMEGNSILVPLTGSMYVPGRLHDTNKLVIDIGTRYYVEKDNKTAKDYFQRKVKFVTEQMEKIQYLGLEKSKIRDTIVELLEYKLAQQQGTQNK